MSAEVFPQWLPPGLLLFYLLWQDWLDAHLPPLVSHYPTAPVSLREGGFSLPAKPENPSGLAESCLWTPYNGRNVLVKALVIQVPLCPFPSSNPWFFLPLSVPISDTAALSLLAGGQLDTEINTGLLTQ